jgi:hypothetical protein
MLRKSPPPNSSCSDLSVGFHYDDLERFLCISIALFCNDTELAASAVQAATGLSSRWQQKGIESFPADVANIAMILDAFITMTSRAGSNNNSNNQNSSTSSNTNNSLPLPANVVYEVHSFMGMLKTAQKNDAAAKVSFMKALWISAAMSMSSSKQEQQVDMMTTTSHRKGYELALTLHRLGRIYARSSTSQSKNSKSSSRSSNYTQAKNLLTKAMEQYEKNKAQHPQQHGKDCHFLLLDVKKELEQLERRRKSREASECAYSLRSRAFQSLPFILEEKTASSSSSQAAAAAERRRNSSAN